MEFAEKGDHQTAARWCAELIKQNYWEPWPYELLIDIYQKHDHTTEATEPIKYSIKIFENLRANMEWRLLYLAEQQNKTEFAKSLIKKGKKVSYPEGLYVLYDTYPCIDKFKAML